MFLLKIFLSSFSITSNIIMMEDKSTLPTWHDRESLSSICVFFLETKGAEAEIYADNYVSFLCSFCFHSKCSLLMPEKIH